MKKTLSSFLTLSAILLSSMTTQSAQAQSKLNLHSKAILKEMQKDNSTKSRANAQAQTHIEAIIRITDQDVIPQLEALGVKVVANLKTIITCSLPIDKLDEISALEGVQTINFGEKLEQLNDRARSVSHVDEVHTMVDRQGINYTGKGVIFGVVDKGYDFQHATFKNEDGKSRVLFFYQPDEQNLFIGGEKYGDYPGRIYSGAKIDSLLSDGGDLHGTHVTGTGAGGRNGSDTYYGMAPEADLAISGFDSSEILLINAVKVLTEKAKAQNKPISINISYGINTGPHDGTSDVSAAIDALAGPGTIISFSAGNEGAKDLYLHKPAGKKIASLLYTKKNSDFSTISGAKIDAWSYDNTHSFTIQLAVVDMNTGEILSSSPVIEANGKRDEELSEYIDPTYFTTDMSILLGADCSPFTGRREARINIRNVLFLEKPNHALALIVDGDAEVDVYTNGVEFTSGNLPEPYVSGDGQGTYSDIATGKNIICVGSYVTRTEWTSAEGKDIVVDGKIGDCAETSSYGTCIDGRTFPTISAPGEYLISAFNHWYWNKQDDCIVKTDDPEHGLACLAGTSMACPVVAGTIALWLQADPTLDAEGVRDIMRHTAIHDEFTEANPIRFGYGKIDAKAGLEYILKKQSDGINEVHDNIAMPVKILDKQKHQIVISKNGHQYNVVGTKLQ